MKPIGFLIALASAASASTALAATADGGGALALAALASKYSPLLKPAEKVALAKLLEGRSKVAFPAGEKITVSVDTLSCRAGNVDIAHHACDLTFADKKVAISGRAAHELYATLVEIGVPPDGAAGTIYEAVSGLECVVDPGEIAQKAGGGAHCKYEPK